MEVAAGTRGAEFVKRFETTWATSDPRAFEALFTDDVVLEQPMMPRVVGRPAARESFERLLRLVPDLHTIVHRWSADGNMVFIEFTLIGTFGGRELSWPAVDRFVLREDLVSERVSYFDPLPLMFAMLTRPRGWGTLLRSGLRPSFARPRPDA